MIGLWDPVCFFFYNKPESVIGALKGGYGREKYKEWEQRSTYTCATVKVDKLWSNLEEYGSGSFQINLTKI